MSTRLVPPSASLTGVVAPQTSLPGSGITEAAHAAITDGSDKLLDSLVATFNIPPDDPVVKGPNRLVTLIENQILTSPVGTHLTQTEIIHEINELLASPELADSPAVQRYDGQ